MSEGTPFSEHPITRDLAELRLRAERHVRAGDDEELLAMLPELETDTQQWAHLWAPAAAIAAHRVGRADAVAILRRAVDGGFSQPELFEGDIEECFASDPDWSELRARMRANVPAPPIELLEWPDAPAALPLRLERLDADREAELRSRLPESKPSAWDTARELLAWVAGRWEHANDHVERADAVEVLDRVEAGERFACVEYSIVLSQSLNALGIPARRVGLMQTDHHTGLGRAHQVSEAWIDDLAAWVLLDGQNGAYWCTDEDRPLGVVELQSAFRAGWPHPRMVGLVQELTERDVQTWWRHFGTVTTTGLGWSAGAFCPIFQERFVLRTDRLVRDPSAAYPALSGVSIGVAGTGSAPALSFHTAHPYARGFVVTWSDRRTELAVDDVWPLELTRGTHEANVLVRTEYGEHPGGRISYIVR